MANAADTCGRESASLGRAASRKGLQLDADDRARIEQLSVPAGWVFVAWSAFHLGLWATGLAAVVLSRGSPEVQLLVALLMGNQLHALTILQHDCGHGSAFGSRVANLWVGRFLAWFIFMPFTTFTELHLQHHAFLGDPKKDPDEWFYDRGPFALFLRESLFLPRFVCLSLARALKPEAKRRVRRELAFNASTYALLAAGLVHAGAVDVLVFGFVLPMLFLAAVFNPISRGYEHFPMACMDASDPRRLDLRHNTVTVTSPIVGFLWANIIFHVEHHMYPRVPFYRLPQVHRMLRLGDYHQMPYPLSGLARLRGGKNTEPPRRKA